MSVQLALVLAAIAPSYLGVGSTLGHRVLATMPPYPAGRADSVHRPGFNGKLWISRPMIGGAADNTLLGWPAEGPAAYGAAEDDGQVVWAVANGHIRGFSPWIRQASVELGRSSNKLEHARNVWLAEHGYTGGVRTFINDAYMPREEVASNTPAPSRSLEPAAVIERPVDMPKFKTRMEVRALPGGAPLHAFRVSWPLGTPVGVLARHSDASLPRVASK